MMLQGDKPLVGNPPDGVIARRQIAEALVRSQSSVAASRKTFELHSERGPEQEDFDPLFAVSEADFTNALDGAPDPTNMPLSRNDSESPQATAVRAYEQKQAATVRQLEQFVARLDGSESRITELVSRHSVPVRI